MAVVNTIDDTQSHPLTAPEIGGARPMSISKIINITSGDSANSIYYLGSLPDTALVDRITFEATDVTGMNDVNVGLYGEDGTEYADNCFADALDFSSISGLPLGPHGIALRELIAAAQVTLANAHKRVYEHAGHVNKALPGSGETNRKAKYRVGMKAVSGASETIVGLATIYFRMPG